VVSTDRGLCGGLNNNLFKKILQELKHHQAHQVNVKFAVIGQKAEQFFKRLKAEIVAYAHHLGDKPKISELIGSVKVMLDAYTQGEIDALYLFSNHFDSTISQKPVMQTLLPVQPDTLSSSEEHENTSSTGRWDYLYEPDAKPLLNLLLTRYIESQVYQGVIENIACEQAAKMMAMKSATDNAGELIKSLKLQYNKARQALITKELAEIVSGAEAVET
jgi:F-type H+-transporting ATPase subunit gamma